MILAIFIRLGHCDNYNPCTENYLQKCTLCTRFTWRASQSDGRTPLNRLKKIFCVDRYTNRWVQKQFFKMLETSAQTHYSFSAIVVCVEKYFYATNFNNNKSNSPYLVESILINSTQFGIKNTNYSFTKLPKGQISTKSVILNYCNKLRQV